MATRAEPRQRAETGVIGLAGTIVRSARDVVANTLEVAALESRLAGIALAAMAAAGFGALMLVLTAWGLLVAAGVSGLIQAGMSVALALLLAAFASLLVAGVLVLMLPWLARRLAFPATRRVLRKIGSNREADTTHTSQGTPGGASTPGVPAERR